MIHSWLFVIGAFFFLSRGWDAINIVIDNDRKEKESSRPAPEPNHPMPKQKKREAWEGHCYKSGIKF